MVTQPMQRPVWQLEDCQARLQQTNLSARIDVSRPFDGLTDLHSSDALSDAHILQVRLPKGKSNVQPSVECYRRGADLVATYSEAPDWPFRAQIYWRAALYEATPREASAVELLASVQTSLLDADPSTSVSSDLRVSEVHLLRDPATGRFETLRIADAISFALERIETSVCCVVCRLEQPDLSYVEMVHPHDFYRFGLQARRESSAAGCDVQLNHQLFPQRLEKGVILRARVLGLFVPRADDLAAASRQYAQFAASEPPLTV